MKSGDVREEREPHNPYEKTRAFYVYLYHTSEDR